MTIVGCDSAVPQPDLYAGNDVWGFYEAGDTPFVWPAADVHAFTGDGVYGIFVPSQSESWWTFGPGGISYLRELLGESRLTVPDLMPAELDIEEGQAERMEPDVLTDVGHAWVELCLGRPAPRRIPWVYGSDHVHASMPPAVRKHRAQWPLPAGQQPAAPVAPPAGFAAWQYCGDVEGGRVDRDVFANGMRFATPDLSSTVVLGPRATRLREAA